MLLAVFSIELEDFKVFIFRLFLALFLGAFIGLERQIKQRNAGLVTNSLVSVGAAIYILVAVVTNDGHQDSLRVVGQIVTGIGFLGAGVIMRNGFTVHGLNTAATIWCSAAVGILAGYGLWMEATISAVTVILTHLILRPITDFIDSRPIQKIVRKNIGFCIHALVEQEEEDFARNFIIQTLKEFRELKLRKIGRSTKESSDLVEIKLEVLAYRVENSLIDRFTSNLMENRSIQEVSIDSLFSDN